MHHKDALNSVWTVRNSRTNILVSVPFNCKKKDMEKERDGRETSRSEKAERHFSKSQ